MKYKYNDYYGYINKIQEQAIKNPQWFWSDDSKASEARQWLYNNGASKIVDEIYENTPEDIKKNIDRKKLSTSVKTDQVKQNIYEGQKKFLDTAGAVGATTLPLIAAAPAIITAPGAMIGGLVGGVLGAKGTDAAVRKLSNNKYSNWGDFISKGKYYGETLNTLIDFTNPGAIIGGGLGAKAGNKIYSNLSNRYTFNQLLKNGQLEFVGPKTYDGYHQSDKIITEFKFPFKERWDVKTHNADPNGVFFSEAPVEKGFLAKRPVTNKYTINSNKTLVQHGDIYPAIDQSKNGLRNYIVKQARKNGADIVLFENIADNQNLGQNVLFALDKNKIKFKGIDPKIKMSEAERLGIPKGERNLQTKPTTWRQGEDAVKMFLDYGEIPIPKNSELYPELLKYVPEARERYGLIGNTSITDEQIAKGLYKRAMQLSGEGNGAVNSLGEPILLFRGDTRRYNILQDRTSPEDLAKMRGTMDNSLGTLFLGEFPSNYQGIDRYVGTHRFFNGDWSFEKSGTGNIGIRKSYLDSAAKDPNFKDGGYTLYSGVFGKHQYPIIVRKLPGYAMESGVNDINAAVVRTKKVRDATPEISVLDDEFLTRGMYGSSPHMRTKYIEDADGFPMYQHPDGTTTPALAGTENRTGMAEHYRYVLDDARKNNQGLLRSNKNSPIRDEHQQYTYYAIPNFNNHNVKYLLGYDLTYPLENSWALYRKQGGKLPLIEKSDNFFQ